MRNFFIISLFALITTACIQEKTGCAILPGGGQYCLQSTSVVVPFEAQQKVEANFKGHHETMITELEVDAKGINFAGFTPFGQKLMQVSYDNQKVSGLASPDKHLNPALLLALLQLSLWPADVARAGLSEPVVLREAAGNRYITHNGRLIMQVQYADNTLPYRALIITLPTIDMTLAIASLPEDEVTP